MAAREARESSVNRTRISSMPALLLAGLFLLGSVGAFGGSLSEPLLWKDADGVPVSFRTLREMEDFLLTAEVRQVKRVPEGTTAPQKVLLEKDGIRLYACFRYVKVNQKQARLQSGAVKIDFRDDAIFEIAAYRLALLLGYRNVPPTVCRTIRGKKGTLQAWVPDCITEGMRAKEERTPPSAWRWALEMQAMQLFDELIFNEDRNMGNVLIDSDWGIWMIDHTRSFRNFNRPLNVERVRWVERGVWKRLTEVPDEAVEEALSEYLTGSQIRTLLARRQVIVAHLRNQIQEQGQGRVLFALWPEAESEDGGLAAARR
jgi:hypothetical protein